MIASPHVLSDALRAELAAILGSGGLIWNSGSLATYENDGFMAKARPMAVCLPERTERVAAVLACAARHGLPVTPRGAGTGLSGGATPVGGGLVVATSRMNRILRLDPENMLAVVQPGVVNLDLSLAAEPYDLYFAPDPSSQRASTVGGNVAENAGGPHCLATGVTTNHVLGMQVVLSGGSTCRLGASGGAERAGYDLAGLVTGSEGNLAFVTEITVRLMRRPDSVRTLLGLFATVQEAGAATSAIIAAGIIPGALEFVDAVTIGALRQGGFRDYPEGCEALLLVELEGLDEQTEADARRVAEIMLACGSTQVRAASAVAERTRLWAGRKGALAALGRLAPNYYIQDGVVPRSRLVDVLTQIETIARRERMLIANVFHAGDGNLHPTILYDARTPGLTERVIDVGAEILRVCVDAGGTLSGEHGVGLEKQMYLDWVFGPEDQAAQRMAKSAFDPEGRLNPGKPFSAPLPRG